MKLITLLTTLIITLASSHVFAKTFICENWKIDPLEEEMQGTMFVGEKKGDTFIIKDDGKFKHYLTYIGGRDATFHYYTSGSGISLHIFSIGRKNNARKYAKDGNTLLGKYDLKIARITGIGVFAHTFCNYQDG